MAIKFKRIIDGKTYNTETSTQIVEFEEAEPLSVSGWSLYQTRHGAYFVFQYRYSGNEEDVEFIEPLTPDQTREWLEKRQPYRVDLIEQHFGEQPEAGSGESKFTLRMPDSLRERLAERAKANGQSLNAWMVRCLESCAAEPLPDAGGRTRYIPPMGNMTGSDRTSWRTKGT